jgi:hypothetical protein
VLWHAVDILPVLHIFLTRVPFQVPRYTQPQQRTVLCVQRCATTTGNARTQLTSRPARVSADSADGVAVSPYRYSAAGVMLTSDSLDSAGLSCWQAGVTGDT